MKKPRIPPSMADLLAKVGPEELMRLVATATSLSDTAKYLHWDDLVHRVAPEGLNHEVWWFALKLGRTSHSRALSLRDKTGEPFHFLVTDLIQEHLHRIDLGAGGRIGVPEPITNPQMRDRYYISSLIEEAITSSQLEGAGTTRRVARQMLRENRPPRDRDEQMILNNYLGMRQIGELKQEPLTRAMVCALHHRLTDLTLDDPAAAGRFRQEGDPIVVSDQDGEVLHRPPAAAELEERMAAMCDFANGVTPAYFVHPVVRSIILHFWLAYDHPFVDGNGRTARALFYWSMLRHGYWLWEFVSISRILRQAPARYARSFLYTETDSNDLTYFIQYQIEVMSRTLDDLNEYIARKTAELQAHEQTLRGMRHLNPRQRALISHALRHPGYQYTIQGHQRSHDVVYQTARTDLLELKDRGLLEAQKVGKTWYFTAAPDLEAKLA
jgi:Fic family protein